MLRVRAPRKGIAGRDHYLDFKSYVVRGGIAGEIALMDLGLLQEFKDAPKTSHLVVVQARQK